MDRDLQMRNQLEFERSQRMLDDLKLQQETKRFFDNHFDNIERTMRPMKEPLGPRIEPLGPKIDPLGPKYKF